MFIIIIICLFSMWTSSYTVIKSCLTDHVKLLQKNKQITIQNVDICKLVALSNNKCSALSTWNNQSFTSLVIYVYNSKDNTSHLGSRRSTFDTAY